VAAIVPDEDHAARCIDHLDAAGNVVSDQDRLARRPAAPIHCRCPQLASVDPGHQQPILPRVEILDSRLLAAGSVDGGILVVGSRDAVLLDQELAPVARLVARRILAEAASALELAIAGRGHRVALAWIDVDGRIAVRRLGAADSGTELRAAGTRVRDLKIALGKGGGWVTWIEATKSPAAGAMMRRFTRGSVRLQDEVSPVSKPSAKISGSR
jgi:hypothetical protein